MWAVSVLIFVSVYATYHLTLFPGVPGGDSGELLANACNGGVNHPPGYPLFSMLANLAVKVPFPRVYLDGGSQRRLEMDWDPTPAWKVNNQAAVLGALSAVLVFLSSHSLFHGSGWQHRLQTRGTTRYSRDGCVSGSIGAIMFALSPLIWEYGAQSAEVFALNNFLCALIIYVTCLIFEEVQMMQWSPRRASIRMYKLVYWGAFVSGLLFANQHSSALFLLVLIPAVLWTVFRTIKEEGEVVISFAMATGAFLLGSSPYLLLFQSNTTLVRGSWGDLTSITGFFRHILRAEYGTFQLGANRPDVETFSERIVLYVSYMSGQTCHLVFPLAIVSVIYASFMAFSEIQQRKLTSISTPAPSGSGGGKHGKKQKRGKSDGDKSNASSSSSQTQISEISNGNGDDSRGSLALFSVLLLCYVFYLVFWHSILSNLPLGAPMPFLVHARFWMQPHILLCVLAGTGSQVLVVKAESFIFSSFFSSSSLSPSLPTPTRDDNFTTTFTRASTSMQVLVVTAVFTLFLNRYFATMNRSHTGWVMQKYGQHQLDSLPAFSLLASHTDLDWNPTRYLMECEGKRNAYYSGGGGGNDDESSDGHVNGDGDDEVTHLNFQLIAYPWFKDRQAPLYPNVVFPPVNFPGISTNRKEEGNAILVRNFLVANGAESLGVPSSSSQLLSKQANSDNGDSSNDGDGEKNRKEKREKKKNGRRKGTKLKAGEAFLGGLYIDMQAINDVELGVGGRWRGLTLVPWGLLYRVFGPLSPQDTEIMQLESLARFKALQKDFPEPSEAFFSQYPPGTWEYAAMSVYHDAQNQLGLNFLTYAIELQKNADLTKLPLLLDRIYIASKLLFNCHTSVDRYGALSSGANDLHKNAAMAWMRLQGLVGVAFQFRESILKLLESSPELTDNLIDRDIVHSLVNKQSYVAVLRHAKGVIRGFVSSHRDDRDVQAFEAALRQIEEADTKQGQLQGQGQVQGQGQGADAAADASDDGSTPASAAKKKKARKRSSKSHK